MPENKELKPIRFPQEIKFDKKPTTEFKNNLDSIRVRLLSAPVMEELVEYIPQWVRATWMERTSSCLVLSEKEKVALVRDVFMGKTLPSALETINLVFEINGISLQEVTHILRHRQASFSADCSADKWWTDKAALVPSAVEQSEEFYDRYRKLVYESKKLYCDMIDSRQISILDARYVLPRCLETFYYMRIPLKDCISFIKQRIDRQIQPETDNVMAYQMYLELLKVYPVANGLIDIDSPAWHFINTARTGKSSNIYRPESNSDKFEWNAKDFLYDCTRDKLNGTDSNRNYFTEVHDKYLDKIRRQEEYNMYVLKKIGIESLEELDKLTMKFKED